MTFRFLHTADWQIGKVFRFLDDSTAGLLQEARLKAITRLGELAEKHDVHHVLVAGDVYDMEALLPRSINQPLERMKRFATVQWHLLPGNHDPHRPNGLWDQILRKTPPTNVTIHVEPKPLILEDESVVLLPAPLHYRKVLNDPTAFMDAMESPTDFIRIALAHGTVTGFGSDNADIANYISPDRPASANLAYLALGDWHGQRRINDRCWYSGTPETDAFDVSGGGQALLVEIDGPQAVPVVTPVQTGEFNWMKVSEHIDSRDEIDHLAEKLRNIDDDLDRLLVDLTVEGALSLEDTQYFQEQIVDGVSAALCHLRVDDRGLIPQPTDEDLDRIDRGGFVRQAAEALKLRAETEGEGGIAAAALKRLYVEHMKLEEARQ